ncbi:MAG: hypothetical protein WAM14_05990 [Candidatus Nitrosopolaris sp.]
MTYEDHPPSYEPKLHSEFYPIVTGGAGSTDLYKGFRTNALFAMQSGVIIPENIRLEQPLVYESTQPVQTSGIMHMYSKEYNFASLQNNFGNIVKGINNSKVARGLNGSLEILVATQIEDNGTSVLTHFTEKGQSDVYDYKGIGSSGMYSNVFLKPFFDKKNITMNKFAKIGYFMIKLLTEYEIDQTVGGEPQIWFIPNTGPLYRDKDRPELISQFEKDSQNILVQFQKLLAFAYQ